jgi:flagellar hook assembly protein FlgD
VETDIVDLSASRLSAQPNPFNPHVNISFGLKTADRVRLCVVDVSGRMVRQIADRRLEAGDHQLGWDGRDDSGQRLASGIYWLCLERTGARETKGVVLLR